MKGLFILLLLALASAVSAVLSPHLQSRSMSDIVQAKRQSEPGVGDLGSVGGRNCSPLEDTIDVARGIIYAYNPSAVLVSVQALPEDYGASVTVDLLTNLTFTAVNTLNGTLIYMTADYENGYGSPWTTNTPVSYQYLLDVQQLPWPIDLDATDAFNYLAEGQSKIGKNGTVYGATLHLPSFNVGPYKAPEVVWTFNLGNSACSVPASASVAGKFMSCVA